MDHLPRPSRWTILSTRTNALPIYSVTMDHLCHQDQCTIYLICHSKPCRSSGPFHYPPILSQWTVSVHQASRPLHYPPILSQWTTSVHHENAVLTCHTAMIHVFIQLLCHVYYSFPTCFKCEEYIAVNIPTTNNLRHFLKPSSCNECPSF